MRIEAPHAAASNAASPGVSRVLGNTKSLHAEYADRCNSEPCSRRSITIN